MCVHKYSRSAFGIEHSKHERLRGMDFINSHPTWIQKTPFSVYLFGEKESAAVKGHPQSYTETQGHSRLSVTRSPEDLRVHTPLALRRALCLLLTLFCHLDILMFFEQWAMHF